MFEKKLKKKFKRRTKINIRNENKLIYQHNIAVPNLDIKEYINFHVWGIFDEKANLLNIILMDENKQQNEFSIQPMGDFSVMIRQINQFLENLGI